MAFVATFVATNLNINTIENLEIKQKHSKTKGLECL